jgi:peroxiredoxin
MTVKVGDRLPHAEFTTMTADGQQKLSTDVVFSGRKVVLFAVPGAFTPTCSMNHLPGYLKEAQAIKARGVDTIACTAVNDVHVMNAWAKH